MHEAEISQILRALGSSKAEEAWAEFLRRYSPIILQVVHTFERGSDELGDGYLFVCEQLSRDRFRRLRRFNPTGAARFPTWLRVVVRNLCLDWRRKEFGRKRVFESIARLPGLEREVFHCVYKEGLTLHETYYWLRPRFPSLTRQRLEESLARVCASLSPRQLWLLGFDRLATSSAVVATSAETADSGDSVPDHHPDPESLAVLNERRAALARAMARLPAFDRLLIRFRYEEGLTLERMAEVAGLKNAQSVDRRIREILSRLEKEMG